MFLLATHWKYSTWLSLLAQAAVALYVLGLSRRAFLGGDPQPSLLVIVAALCVITPLPWFTSQLMPDLFTSLLVLVLAVLVLRPAATGDRERFFLVLLATFMIAAHLSNLWISVGLMLFLLPARRWLGAESPLGWRCVGIAVAPMLLAVLGLCAINLVAFHRFAVSPFGNVFLLARLIYDGPAEQTLEDDCAHETWRLCAFAGRLPPNASDFPTSDHFLWRPDSPIVRLGGAKKISDEAGRIIHRTLVEHPAAVLGSALFNFGQQLTKFKAGDGLHAWSNEVGPAIAGSFPARESRAFQASLESRDLLQVPAWIASLQRAAFWLGLVFTILALALAIPRRDPVAMLCATVLLCLLGNAAVTGMLSGPHDRYQNRVIWLALLVPLLTARKIWATSELPQRIAAAGASMPLNMSANPGSSTLSAASGTPNQQA